MSDNHHDAGEAPSYDDINTPVVMLVGAISAVVTLLTIFFVQGLAYNWQNAYLSPSETLPTSPTAVEQIEKQKAILSSDQTTLTIDEAMSAVVAKYKK